METKFTLFLGNISRLFLYLTVITIPLLVLPLYGDRFELTKYFVFIFLVLLSWFFLLTKMVVLKKIEWKRTVLDVPILLLLVSYLVSSLLSQHYYISIVGNFNFLGISGLMMVFTALFYFLLVQHGANHPRRITTILLCSLVAGGAAAFYTILRAVGIIQTNAIFSPTLSLVSSSNVLTAVFFAAISVSSIILLATKARNLPRYILASLIALVTLAAIVLLGFKVSWIVFGIGLAVGLVFLLTYFNGIKQVWYSLVFALLIIALLFIILNITQVFSLSLPTEIFLGFKSSWIVATQTLRSGVGAFFFGSGPETYSYTFSSFRPEILNTGMLSSWQFSQAGTAIFQFLTVSGVGGVGVLIITFLIVLKFVLSTWRSHLVQIRSNKILLTTEVDGEIYVSMVVFWAYVVGWLVFMGTMWVLNIGLSHWLMMWIFMAGIILSGHVSKNVEIPNKVWSFRSNPESTLGATFGFIAVLSILTVMGIYLGKFMAAEVIFANSLQKPLPEKISSLNKAIYLNYHEAKFYAALSESLLLQTAQMAKSGADANKVYEEAALAVEAAKKATYYAPEDAQMWYFLGVVYANVQPLIPEANTWGIRSLQEAIAHDPKNGSLYLSKAVLETVAKQYSEAAVSLQKSIDLNPSLLESYVRLASFKDVEKDIAGVINVLEKGTIYAGSSPQYLFELGSAYFKRHEGKDVEQAETYLRRAISLDNNYANALYVLALIDEEKNNTQEALIIYERLAQLNPDNKEVLQKIINLSKKKDQTDSSLTTFSPTSTLPAGSR